MSASANHPCRFYDDNRSQALAMYDLDLTGSVVRALANVMKEAAPVACGDYPDPSSGKCAPRPKRKTPSRIMQGSCASSALDPAGSLRSG